MVNAIDACDDKTYWEAFEMLLAVHEEVLNREHRKMVAGQAKLDEMPEAEKLTHCQGAMTISTIRLATLRAGVVGC
jgi:hypothetical protein